MGESRKGDFLQTRLRHVEDANLVAGAEAVLHAPQDAGVGGSVALHVQNHVHHVFERPGTRDVSCFRDMPGDENGCVERFRHLLETCGAETHLRHRSRRGGTIERLHRLDGVDDHSSVVGLLE